MQDPSSTYYQAMMKPPPPHFPEHEQLKCPRCESTNTKFCYYNNYNLSQPRHFCKSCRRYWTKGGALRNIPIGGGSRKNTKRTSGSQKRQVSVKVSDPNPRQLDQPPLASSQGSLGVFESSVDQERRVFDMGGSFSSLLASNLHFLEGTNQAGSNLKPLTATQFVQCQGLNFGSHQNTAIRGDGNESEGTGVGQMSYCSSGCSNGWPDLAIYTPSSSFP